MSEGRKKILDLLASGKINAEEAERLLDALGNNQADNATNSFASAMASGETRSGKPKYLRIIVEPKHVHGHGHDKVNIRIPLGIIEAGMKIGAIMPDHARDKINAKLRDKGIDLDINNLKDGSFDELFKALKEMNIDIDDEDEKVKIFCES